MKKTKTNEIDWSDLLPRITKQHEEMIAYITKHGYEKFSTKIYNIELFVEYSSQWTNPHDDMKQLEMFQDIQNAFINAYD